MTLAFFVLTQYRLVTDRRTDRRTRCCRKDPRQHGVAQVKWRSQGGRKSKTGCSLHYSSNNFVESHGQLPKHKVIVLLLLQFYLNPCPGSSFFATFAGSWEVFYPQAYLEFQSTQQQNSNCYTQVFGVKRFNGATSGTRDVDIQQKSKMADAKMKCTYFTALWLMEYF